MNRITTDTVLSIVIPLFNERDNIPALIERLVPVAEGLQVGYEILLIDDGSRDRTWEQIQRLATKHRGIKGLRLVRNFGHQHALLAGLRYASGRAIITMDGDLQHPPEAIPELFSAWQQGYKVVNTVRQDQVVSSRFKRLTSKYFYRFFSALADVHIAEGSSDFRLIDRQVLAQIERFNDVDLFLRGAVHWLGFPSTTVAFVLENRLAGQSKYTLRRMARFASGAIVSFSTKPLRIGIWLGIVTSSLAFLELLYVVVQYFRGFTVAGWASTMAVLSFLFGVLFIILGIIGVYLARIHQVLQNRPKFVVSETVNLDPNSE